MCAPAAEAPAALTTQDRHYLRVYCETERLAAQLGDMGVTAKTLARWERELRRCTTYYQVQLTEECHRMEAFLIGRYTQHV